MIRPLLFKVVGFLFVPFARLELAEKPMFSPASSMDIYFFGFHLSSNLFRYSKFSLLTLRCFNA